MEGNNITVLDFTKREEEGMVRVTYKDSTSEILQSSSFGESSDIDNFLAFTNNKNDELLCMINKDHIKKIDFNND